MSKNWKPNASLEQGKLAPKESDWTLPGSAAGRDTTITSRTRHGGEGRPNLNRNMSSSSSSLCSSSDETWCHYGDGSTTDDTLEGDDDDSRPTPSRIIIEVDQLKRTLEEFSQCKTCNGPMDVSLCAKGFGLATKIEMTCLNKKCHFVHHGEEPARTSIHSEENDAYDRLMDYAINCVYVLAFIASGDGPTEAERLLGLLGMPNNTSMGSSTFKKVENRMGPFIRNLAEEILLANLKKEVRATLPNESDFEQWCRSIDPNVATPPLPKERYPVIKCSFDNAWQQKSSGHKRDSPSGHGLMFGHKTRLPLCYEIKSKVCDFCTHQKKKYPGVPRANYECHDCTMNFDGSSGAMEAATLLDLVILLHDKFQVQVGLLCCDDDSSVRADCQWNNATYLQKHNTTVLPQVKITRGKNKGELQDRPDKGLLPAHIMEPTFVSDPNHRGKLLTGELYSLEQGNVSTKATLASMDITRIGKNFKYMGRTLQYKAKTDYEKCGKAVLDHHFDCHDNCDVAWCRRKEETPEQRLKSKQYYRDKVTDKELYSKLETILSRYISQERLEDIAHGMDTNANESFNNTCSWLAPKNKVYCGSRSLWNRISIAICIVSVGIEEFYKRLFKAMGIQLTEHVLRYLQIKNQQRSRRVQKQKTAEKKLIRNKRKFEKLQKDTLIAKKERLMRAGKYRRGMNLDLTVEEEMLLPVRIQRQPTVCSHPFCGLAGHKTTRSKNCLANPQRLQDDGTVDACAAAVAAAAAAAAPVLQQDAVDLNQHEAVPLVDDEDDSSLELYTEAKTWSEDEDGNVFIL